MNHQAYLCGVGGYSPGEPVPFERIDEVLGAITQAPPKLLDWIERMRPIMQQMLGVRFCHYAIDPQTRQPSEDNVTMSVCAAHKALDMAGIKAQDIDLLVHAGVMAENICPPTTVLIQEALQIPYCAEYEIHSNCSSIYKAIQLASDQIKLGRYRTALITTSQLSSAFLRVEHFNQAILEKRNVLLRWFLSDGAGALVISSDPSLGRQRFRVVDTYTESMGLGLGPDMVCVGGGFRVSPHESYDKGWHHLSQNFEHVAKLGVELARKASERMMQRIGIPWGDIKYMLMNVPTLHIYDQVVDEMKRDHDLSHVRFFSRLADCGYPGPPAIVQCLESFLKEEQPNPGDLMLSVVAESSKWMYGGFVLEYVGHG